MVCNDIPDVDEIDTAFALRLRVIEFGTSLLRILCFLTRDNRQEY